MTEEWRDIPGYEGFYQVSDLGRSRSLDRIVPHAKNGTQKRRGSIKRPYPDKDGYLCFKACKDNKPERIRVHQAVCQAFNGPGNGLWALHKDGDNQNNVPENLYWGTPSQNQIDSILHGTNASAKLTPDIVEDILHLLNHSDLTQAYIADIYCIDPSVISRIKSGHTWSHIERD